MFSAPVRSDYCSYGDFAMAVVGFALVSGVSLQSDRYPTGVVDGDVVGGPCCDALSRLVGRVVGGDTAGGRGFRQQSGCADASGRFFDDGVGCKSCCVHDVAVGVGGCQDKGASSAGGLRGDCLRQDEVDVVGCPSVEDKSAGVSVGSFVAGQCGPNREWNRAKRQAQKLRKKKRQALQQDWRLGGSAVSGGATGVSSGAVSDGRAVEVGQCGRGGLEVDEKGFWNSCSGDVRQQLIDSKARMHIAENERREKKARDELAEMDSPIAMVQRVLKLVKLTEESAKRANDNRVAGWAKTVAQSHSESVAKSAPSTMQSFDSFVNSSSSSVPIEIHDELLKKYLASEAEKERLEKKFADQFAAKDKEQGQIPQRSSLQLRLENEILQVEKKYAEMSSCDPAILFMEKQMIRNKRCYASLKG